MNPADFDLDGREADARLSDAAKPGLGLGWSVYGDPVREEAADCGEDLELGGQREPVALTGEDVRAMGDARGGEAGIEIAGEAEGNDGVCFAVKDQGRRKGSLEGGGERIRESAGDLDERASLGPGRF